MSHGPTYWAAGEAWRFTRLTACDEFAQDTSAVTGPEMSWFFKEWIKETGIRDLDVPKAIQPEGDRLYLAGRLKQRDAANLKTLLVSFVFESSGGVRGVDP